MVVNTLQEMSHVAHFTITCQMSGTDLVDDDMLFYQGSGLLSITLSDPSSQPVRDDLDAVTLTVSRYHLRVPFAKPGTDLP